MMYVRTYKRKCTSMYLTVTFFNFELFDVHTLSTVNAYVHISVNVRTHLGAYVHSSSHIVSYLWSHPSSVG